MVSRPISASRQPLADGPFVQRQIASLRTMLLLSAPKTGSSLTLSCGTAAEPNARTGRIRCVKDAGLRNAARFAQNQIWCEIVVLACELLAWMQMLAFIGPARRREPRRIRLRIFAVVGKLVRGGRRLRLCPARHWY
jgi:Transposase DDE domain group 1